MINTLENGDFAHAEVTPNRVFLRNTMLTSLFEPFFARITDRQEGR
jgi:hypothetical protein